ncbi:ABC transporter substrate-binding protein [Blastococcus sp. SYSU D00820]
MRPTARTTALSLAAIASVALTGCAAGQKQDTVAADTAAASVAPGADCDGTTDTLSVNVALAPTVATVQLGEESGIFAEHCLSVALTVSTSPPPALAAVVGGSADITYLPAVNVVLSRGQGLPIRVVAPNEALPEDAADRDPETFDPAGVYAAEGGDISSAADLEGKTVAVPGRGAQLEMSVAAAVADDGGDPATINWVQLDQATMLQQLEAGQIDAATFTSPFTTQAGQAGFERVVSPTTALYAAGTTYSVWVTTETALGSKTEAIQRFHDAILEVNQYAMEHVDEFRQVLSEATRTPLEVVEAGPGVFLGDEVSVDVLEDVADTMSTLGYLDQRPDLDDVVVSFG